MAVDNAKLETAVGSCGLGSCRSSCCEEQAPELSAEHKQMEIATRAELALVHKMVTDLEEMIAALKSNGELPRLDVIREAAADGLRRITVVVSKK